MSKYYQGFFKPKNPKKYRGNPSNIVYRSFLEFRVMRYFDNTKEILEWFSEELAIPYVSPKDNRIHRYFPDFYCKIKTKDGIKEYLIEVKPYEQTKVPKKGKSERRYINEILTYTVNEAKWNAAKTYCDKKNWIFKVITEKDI